MNIMTRSYQLRQRAESQNRTRQKIVEAAIELHQTKGPAATSMADIAERAEVGKVTVYRHFPDDAEMINACSGLFFERHPFPDQEHWRSIPDASERFRQGLSDTYAYHRSTEAMMNHVMAEMRDDPLMAPYHDHWRQAADVLIAPWAMTGSRRKQLKAAITLALSFETWRALVQGNGLTESQAVDLMLCLTCECPPT